MATGKITIKRRQQEWAEKYELKAALWTRAFEHNFKKLVEARAKLLVQPTKITKISKSHYVIEYGIGSDEPKCDVEVNLATGEVVQKP